MQDLIRRLLFELGENPDREGLVRTPARVEDALRFLTAGYDANIDDVLNDALFTVDYNEMVIVKDIDFYSLCEHHLLPFFGKCHVAYIPRKRVIGLSKIPRLVDVFARRLQIQERMTNQIAETIEVDSKKRPDLLIFNRPFAFADAGPPFSAIVIIEFKRPARDDFSDKEEKNPILQVYDYIGLLKEGKAKDRRGVPISVPDRLPIYAYVVCDLTPTLQKQARDYQLTKTPDSQGYFGYHKEYGAYIEVISFDKLIDDAKRRNKILFDKLGLHGEASSST